MADKPAGSGQSPVLGSNVVGTPTSPVPTTERAPAGSGQILNITGVSVPGGCEGENCVDQIGVVKTGGPAGNGVLPGVYGFVVPPGVTGRCLVAFMLSSPDLSLPSGEVTTNHGSCQWEPRTDYTFGDKFDFTFVGAWQSYGQDPGRPEIVGARIEVHVLPCPTPTPEGESGVVRTYFPGGAGFMATSWVYLVKGVDALVPLRAWAGSDAASAARAISTPIASEVSDLVIDALGFPAGHLTPNTAVQDPGQTKDLHSEGYTQFGIPSLLGDSSHWLGASQMGWHDVPYNPDFGSFYSAAMRSVHIAVALAPCGQQAPCDDIGPLHFASSEGELVPIWPSGTTMWGASIWAADNPTGFDGEPGALFQVSGDGNLWHQFSPEFCANPNGVLRVSMWSWGDGPRTGDMIRINFANDTGTQSEAHVVASDQPAGWSGPYEITVNVPSWASHFHWEARGTPLSWRGYDEISMTYAGGGNSSFIDVTLNYSTLDGYAGGGTTDVFGQVVSFHSGLDYNFWLLYDFSDQPRVWSAGVAYRITFEYTGWGIGTQPFYFGHCTVNPASSAFLYNYPTFTPNPNPLFDDAVYAELQPLPDDSGTTWTKVTFTWTPSATHSGNVYILFGRREGTYGMMRIRDAQADAGSAPPPVAAGSLVVIQGSGAVR